MADKNPYMNEQSGRRRGAHFAPEVTPVQPAYRPDLQPVPPKRRSKLPLVLLLLLALCGGGLYLWTRLGGKLPGLPGLPKLPGLSEVPGISTVVDKLSGEEKVTITLNGEEARVAAGSTVQEIFEAEKPDVAAGNLLSVSGNVLGEGEGEPYVAVLDGAELTTQDAQTAVVEEGASLTFSDGTDLTENFTVETVATSTPKLVRKVQEGTTDPSYMVQEGVIQYVYQWGKAGSKEVRTGTISGETVDGNVVEGQDCIIMCQDIHPDNDEKLVALTFDDGPTSYTERYMDIFDRYGIKATFNLIGEQVEECADVVKLNCESGNQICSHTWNHPDLTTIDQEQTLTQLNDTYDVIKRVGGYDTSTIRPPYGDIDINVWLKSGGRTTLSVFWTHDSEDWKLPGVDAIVANCTGRMAPGSVILLHDGGGNRDQNLEALPRIIEAWQDAGYRFVTVSELMASDSSIPEECCATYRPMPEDAIWPTELAEQPASEDAAEAGEDADAEDDADAEEDAEE